MRKIIYLIKALFSEFSAEKLNLPLLVLFFLFVSFVRAIYPGQGVYAQDKITAIVNNDVITQKDLEDFTNFMQMQLSRDYTDEEVQKRMQSLKNDLINKLIEDRLILQEAKKNNVKLDESRVKAKIAEVKKRYRSDSEFQKELTKQGLVQADVEQKIREQLLMYNIVESEVRDKIMVNPEEVTAFYDTHTKEFFSPEERELEMITLENGDQASSFAYALKRQEKLVDLAARYPVSVDKISCKKGGELRKEIEDVVFNMGLTEVSDPIKVGTKYYIFKLENIIPPKQETLPEAQNKIHAFLVESKMQEKMAKWLDELKAKSYIKIL